MSVIFKKEKVTTEILAFSISSKKVYICQENQSREKSLPSVPSISNKGQAPEYFERGDTLLVLLRLVVGN